jgi:hypothetical protein
MSVIIEEKVPQRAVESKNKYENTGPKPRVERVAANIGPILKDNIRIDPGVDHIELS